MSVVEPVSINQVKNWLEYLTNNLYKQEKHRAELFRDYVVSIAKNHAITHQPELVSSLSAHILVIKLLGFLFRDEDKDYSSYCEQIAKELEQAFGWPEIAQGQVLPSEILDEQKTILTMLHIKAQKGNNAVHQRLIEGYIISCEGNKCLN